MRIREDTSSQIPNGIANVRCRFLGRAFFIFGVRRRFLAEQLKDAYVHFPFGIEMFSKTRSVYRFSDCFYASLFR